MKDTKFSHQQSDPSDNTAGNTPSKGKGKAVVLAVSAIVLILALGGVAFWAGVFPGKEAQINQKPSTSKEVWARVNGEEITDKKMQERVSILLSDALAQGVEVTQEQRQLVNQQALQQLINETLLLQAAQQAGVVVDDSVVENQYQQIVASFSSPDDFDQALAKNGTTAQGLKNDIKRQLTIQAYLDTQIDKNKIQVNDKDVEDLYNQYAANADNIPPLEVIAPQIKQQLEQQKYTEQVTLLLQKLADNAQIEIL